MPVLAASSSPSDRTYSVAIGVILAFAALEILAIAIHFGAQYHAEHATLEPLKRPAAPTTAKPTPPPLPAQPDAPSFAALSASDRLLKEANVLRERGDTANALARLQDAAQRDPGNPQVLAEMAAIYESIQLFDRSKLRIMVLFYDSVDTDKVVATDADVNYEWMNPKHDWAESNPETLIVTYLRSKTHAITSEASLSAAAAAVTPGKNAPRSKKRGETASGTDASDPGRRRYLGYVIRILYDDKLQTVRAEPARLINDAPNPSVSP